MKLIADIHLHSYFSRATSKNLNLEHLAKWAQLKGVNIVGTGDIAHPGWLEEMRSKLDPAEDGLFRLKPEIAKSVQPEVFKACRGEVRFILAGEISNIYKKNDKVRKIHNVVFFPTFEALEKFQAELEKIGNIRSDGRPILGLDARDLFEIVLETDPQGHLIPAHIWTPWFSLLGSMSGFDSVEECFGDLTEHIFALETGLSSDPPMNWRLSALDNYTLVSNSDAHSPAKLAREANVFDTEMSYSKLFDALRSGDSETFLGTIEFFPEEGKYHYDGHRKCGIRWHPKTTLDHDKLCPECGRPVTVGVMHRVEILADREPGGKPARTHPFKSLIPLPEVLAEIYECGVNTKKVNRSFEALLTKLGPELHILQDVPLDDLDKIGGSLLAEAVRRMRHGEVKIAAGYDGEYGIVRLFEDDERDQYSVQIGFFEQAKPKKDKPKVKERNSGYRKTQKVAEKKKASNNSQKADLDVGESKVTIASDSEILHGLNAEQRDAVTHTQGHLIVVAGPGTGKTRTLTHRIAYLLASSQGQPEQILAVTFTNKAAQGMRSRLTQLLNPEAAADLTVKTLHAFAAQLLREHGREIGVEPQFVIADDRIRSRLLKSVRPSFSSKETTRALDLISRAKNQLIAPEDASPFGDSHGVADFAEIYRDYQSELMRNHILDYDDLIACVVKLLTDVPDVREKLQTRYRWISVDEYQDINFAQYQFLRLLTAKADSVCVIGDPDQAIYGFRGASRSYFLKFQKAFPHARKVQLTKNYRSTQLILDASSQIISKSAEHYTSKIWSDFISQTKIDIYPAPTAEAEAEYVVHQVEKMVGGTSYFSLDSGRVGDDEAGSRTFGDFVVLYRLNALSGLLETAFNRSGIPYQTAGELPLFERPEAQHLLKFLWFVYQPHSNLHLQNILESGSNRLGSNTLAKLHATAEKRGETLWQTMQHDLMQAHLDVSQRKVVQTCVAGLRTLLKRAGSQNVAELIEYVSQTFFPETYFTETELRKAILKQLLSKARAFENNLQGFLESTVLSSESDFHDPRADRVSLMTLHAAKGLEFKVVFIVGCEETLIPYQKNGKIDDLEEERRLFYVGMTRAQEKLTLSHAKSRLLFGKRQQNPPSRFLGHFENSLKEIRQMQYKITKTEKLKKSQMKLF